MKKHHAFTLIELLVVIAIIAILAGLALPVYNGAMEKGRAVQDKKNLSSIGASIMIYLGDNDNRMFSLAGTASDAWPSVLQAGYVKNWNVFRSPFDKVSASRPANATTPPVPVSYGLSEKVFDTIRVRWTIPGSQVILAAPAIDTSVTGKTVQFMTTAVSNKNVSIPTPTGTNLGTHQSRQSINVLFGDGHVEEWAWTNYILNGTDEQKQHWDPMYVGTQSP